MEGSYTPLSQSPPRYLQLKESAPDLNGQALDHVESSGGYTTSANNSRRPKLSFLEIPGRPLERSAPNSTRINAASSATPRSARAGLPPRPSSMQTKLSTGNNSSHFSWIKNATHNGDTTALLVSGRSALVQETSHHEQLDKPCFPKQFSLTKDIIINAKKTMSLPTTPVGNSPTMFSQDRHLIDIFDLNKPQGQKQMTRSLSAPGNDKDKGLQVAVSPCLIYITPVTPRAAHTECATKVEITDDTKAVEDNGENISEEEAVCRICFVELGGGGTLKMECSCKGELALAHEECAVKWFSMKGNKICEVCKQDVRNLPVTLLRLQSTHYSFRLPANIFSHSDDSHYRVWQDVPVLLMVSILAYFCFLEQLLLNELGSHALALSLPFACVLGLLSSFIACTMVSKAFVWVYASVQFAIVVFFAYIFYSVLIIQYVFSILLSSFTGFGMTIGVSTLVEFMKWRALRSNRYEQHWISRSQQQPVESVIETEQVGDIQQHAALS